METLDLTITDVQIHRLRGHYSGPTFPPGQRQAQQLDVYPEFNDRPYEGDNPRLDMPLEALYVEVLTDSGLSGLWGPIETYQAHPLLSSLRPYLIGRDPLATELLFDQMARMDRHGRSGLFMTAISAIDCALWDLKGKVFDLPVYRLLGGPTRAAVPAYASMLGFPIAPDEAAATALAYKEQGYDAQKWFFRYGPGDGEAGKTKNLEMAAALRDAVGLEYKLMFDAFMGWDTTYAIEMVRLLAPLGPTWVEEPVPPERIGALSKIRQASPVPIATGEHIYTRWQAKELLVSGAVDFLQNDPDWTGGISELTKVCALASSFDTPVIAHGHSLLPALHVAGAQSPATVPFVEYLVRYQEVKQYFQQQIYRPLDGLTHLPTLPGLGIVLDEERIESRDLVTYD